MRRTARLLLLATASTLAGACTDQSGDRAKEQLAALQRKKAEAAAAPAKANPGVPAVHHLPAPYDETQAVVLTPDGQCPEGLWALFPGEAPGETADAKRANEARRAELARGLSTRPWLVMLRGPSKVTLSPHDAAKGRFLIEVAGAVDCIDSTGHLTVAWTAARALESPGSAVSRGAEVLPNLWQAPPLTFEHPMRALGEAKAFYDTHRTGLSARVAVTPGKVEVDRKLRRMGKVSKTVPGETVAYGGGVEDWGAGRLLRATLVGVRVATDQERTELVERRPPF